jgi:elongation factor 1-gamma
MQVLPNLRPIMHAIFGEETDGSVYQNSSKFIKEFLMTLSKQLAGKSYLVGDSVTVADIYLAGILSAAFGTFIDIGVQKASPNVKSWFDAISKLDSFVAAFGHLKCAQRAIKPINLTQNPEEKKKEEEQKKLAEEKKKQAAAAAKPKVVEAKPAGPSIDTLPKTDFDLFNYKTFYVNHPDKQGEGMAETKKMF